MVDRSHISVREALEQISGRRVFVVGDAVLDTYLYGETVRVSREAPVLVVRKERMDYRLGGAANTAANLAALGVRTSLIGVVGSDAAAKQLRAMLEDKRVDTTHLVEAPGATPNKMRILAGAFGTARQQVLRIDDEPRAAASLVNHPVASLLRNYAAGVDAIILSDYSQGSIDASVIAAARELSAAGHLVCVDSRQRLASFVGASAVTPNIPEAEALVGFALTDSDAVARAGRQIVAELECRHCLLKQGRAGMSLFGSDGNVEHVAIVGEDEVADVTGAGDTVIAVFAAGLAAGLGAGNAMRLANCAAGVVVTKIGTASASPEEIVNAARRAGMELGIWPG